MAQRVPVPTPSPGGGSGTTAVWLINLLDWIFQILQETVGFLAGVQSINAKLGVLVGNDARLQVDPNLVPDWVEAIVNRVVTTTYRPLNEGCLGFREIDTGDNSVQWVGFHRMVNAYLHEATAALSNASVVRTPYYASVVDTEHAASQDGQTVYKVLSKYSTEPNPDDPISLDAATPKPNLIHLIATGVALLSMASRIPLATINETQLAKLDDTATEQGSWHGSITDAIHGEDVSIISDSTKYVRTSLKLDPNG